MALPEEGVVMCPFCGGWIEIRRMRADGALPAMAGYAVMRPAYSHPPPFCRKFEDISADDLTELLTKD